ncbi:MAG: mannosyl-3-phosphoglycerate phosphatase [Gammaproteobacteria bacterium]|nr:MAG: mannosyl-3-phosphoglycerate phosphatase [Pseudomonadota bacterium]PIE38351.1 MAG: mannosyl-3-phosphoglycerate phosphatase [Gammaproteobacteria bacterium]
MNKSGTRQRLLVFSDLDGSLLDHHSYSYAEAQPSLERLRSLHIPLILNSSKTFQELIDLSVEMGLDTPFIVENGAGICIPETSPLMQFVTDQTLVQAKNGYQLVSMATRQKEMMELLGAFKLQFRFSTFDDLGIEQLAALTGLTASQAKAAALRDFTQPIQWQDSQSALIEFAAAFNKLDYTLQQGGRFLHLVGEANKGTSLQWLANAYQSLWGEEVITAGLGDGGNDIPMLEVADYPILISSPVNSPPDTGHIDNLVITGQTGPAGWNRAINDLLDTFELCY